LNDQISYLDSFIPARGGTFSYRCPSNSPGFSQAGIQRVGFIGLVDADDLFIRVDEIELGAAVEDAGRADVQAATSSPAADRRVSSP